MKPLKMNGKVAVVTGSSRGIGKAIAIDLANQGASIVLNGRDESRLKEVKKIIHNNGGQAEYVCYDVSKNDSGERLLEAALESFGRLDFLVNNVGVSMRGSFANANPDVFRKVFESNLMGTINPTISCIPELKKRKGSVVFISSLASIHGLPGLSAYSSSKMALRALAESIRLEEKKNGLHVGLVLVGMTQIEHNKEVINEDGSMIKLKSRSGKNIQSMEHVAKKVRKNILGRKYITTLTVLGKMNRFLNGRFPLLVERIFLGNLNKFEEQSK